MYLRYFCLLDAHSHIVSDVSRISWPSADFDFALVTTPCEVPSSIYFAKATNKICGRRKRLVEPTPFAATPSATLTLQIEFPLCFRAQREQIKHRYLLNDWLHRTRWQTSLAADCLEQRMDASMVHVWPVYLLPHSPKVVGQYLVVLRTSSSVLKP